MTTSQPPQHLVAPPGDILEEWLEEHDVTQRELAARTDKSEKFISQLINGKATLTADTAHDLALVTGIGIDTWLRLEAMYQAASKRAELAVDPAADSPVEAALLAFLRKCGVVTADGRDKPTQKLEVLGFLGVASADGAAKLAARRAVAFRTSTAFTPDAMATEVLLRLAQIQAELVTTSTYNGSRLREALPRLRALTMEPPHLAARAAREELATCGVALVFVPNVPKAHCHGVTMWKGGRVILALSDRGKSEDVFWFTLFHELGHVLLGKRDEIYLDAPGKGGKPAWEQQADEFAAETLIPADEQWRLSEISSLQDAADAAAHLGVSPAIVVGRLQHLGLKPYSWGNGLKRQVTVELPHAG